MYSIYNNNRKSVVRLYGYSSDAKLLSKGSAVVFGKDKYLLTAAHAVRGCEKFLAHTDEGQSINADLVSIDEEEDLAILKPRTSATLKAVNFSSLSDFQITPGLTCISLSYPINELYTSIGHIGSYIHPFREKNGKLVGGMIVSDIKTLSGSSGGALLDATGALIGLNYAVYSDKGGIQLSFAYSTPMIKPCIDNMLYYSKKGVKTPPKASVDAIFAPLFALKDFYRGLNTSNGVVVVGVIPGGNCDGVLEEGVRDVIVQGTTLKAGGDIITSIDDYKIDDISDIYTSLRAKKPGDKVEIKFIRSGKENTKTIQLSPRPQDYFTQFIQF